MYGMDTFIAHRDAAEAEVARDHAEPLPSLVPQHTMVLSLGRHKHDDVIRYAGSLYWLPDDNVASCVERGLVSVVGTSPANYWHSDGRILGAEDVEGVRSFTEQPHSGSLRILAGCGYDPGSAAYRLHTALNETTKHASMFVRWGHDNPHCDLRQKDGELDIAQLRDAFAQADVIHNHVAYFLPNNLGMRPRPDQLLVRHYHGSDPKGGTHIDHRLDKARQTKLFGARLSLVEEARTFGLEMEWSPIPVPVQRYRELRDEARYNAVWTPLFGAATKARPLVIGHSPTDMAIKGTAVLRDVVATLQAKGVPVRLELIHGVSLREALHRKALCDVFFDSFWLGIQGSGLEASAMEMPVIAGDPLVRELYQDRIGHCPYLFATDAPTLSSTIEALVLDEDCRDVWARKTAKYVADYHDYSSVAALYENSIARWTGRTDIITARGKRGAR